MLNIEDMAKEELVEALKEVKNEIVEVKHKLTTEFDRYLKQYEENVDKLKDEKIKLEYQKSILESEIKHLKEEIEYFKNIENAQKIKNERGAGRKKKFDEKMEKNILKARRENKSIRAIAKEFNCSVGLVQKIISENK